jgi:hypothetical protein
VQKDVRFGLILAAAIALACGSKRISFATSDGAAPASAGEAAEGALQAGESAPPLSTPPLILPNGPEQKSAAKPPPAAPAQESPGNPLADVFPKDLRQKSETAGPKAAEPAAPKLVLPFGAKSKPAATPKPSAEKSDDLELTLPADDFLNPASQGPIPKPLPEAKSSAAPAKGPRHPYFQRFLDAGEYFVREGDSLADIADNLYQDEAMADAILSANSSTLKSADDLRPGMRLALPK